MENNVENNNKPLIDNYEIVSNIYYEKLKDAEKMNCDENFVKFYHNGSVMINNNIYTLEKMFLIFGEYESNQMSYLVDVLNGDFDVFYNKKYENFKIKSITPFKNSVILYNIYLNHKDDIDFNDTITIKDDEISKLFEEVKEWKGQLHDKVPETAALLTKEDIEKAKRN